jgi:hypothetical protein
MAGGDASLGGGSLNVAAPVRGQSRRSEQWKKMEMSY